MLAVQRPPSMGSSKPPNDMPFGYDFNTPTSNYPFPSPPAPAPGTSLLDENESKFLENFFDGVSSDQYNYDLFNNPPDGTESGGWDELPPTFMGTTSSFGQQPQNGSHGLADMNTQMSAPPIPPTATADVLAAAALLQNGTGRSHSMSEGALLRGQDLHMHSTNGHPRSQSLSQHPNRLPSGFDTSTTGDDYMRDTFYTDMVFGSGAQPTAWSRNPGTSQRADIRWGSDAGFGTPQGFVPPDSQDSIEATERSHVHVVENAFSIGASRIPGSADTTAPPSPIVERGHQRVKSIPQNHGEDQGSRPRKRRKSKFEEEAEEEDDSPVSAAPKSASRKRKSFKRDSKESEEPESSDKGHKRRKSAAAANASAKLNRENLTEEQKRENHIKSEQKRRTLIREGFEDLNELVPGLRGGGFSKSAVLMMAADWLEDLIQGNQVLQRKLDQMEGK